MSTQLFNHSVFGQLPTVLINEKEWFGATEAANALSFSNPHAAIKNHIEEDDLTVHEVIDSLGRKQLKKFTNESGIYTLIMGASKQGNNLEIKKRAKKFKRWITHEVIPSIRKHGAYMTESTIEKVVTDPNFLIQLGQTLKTEQEARKAAEQKVAEQQQKLKDQETPVAIYNLAISANNTLSMLEVSKSLGLGRTTLYKILRVEGIIMKDSTMPYQRYLDAGYFKVVERPRASGDTIINDPATRVTARGFDYIARLLQKRADRKPGLGVEA